MILHLQRSRVAVGRRWSLGSGCWRAERRHLVVVGAANRVAEGLLLRRAVGGLRLGCCCGVRLVLPLRAEWLERRRVWNRIVEQVRLILPVSWRREPLTDRLQVWLRVRLRVLRHVRGVLPV